MLYFAGIRALGENNYIATGNCLESEFYVWIKRAVSMSAKLKKRLFVDFRQRAHTFEIESSGEAHLLTPENMGIIDPALAAQFEGS